jgi:hypothetical protein
MMLMVCSTTCIKWFCVVINYSRLMGLLLVVLLMGWPLYWLFLVFAIR